MNISTLVHWILRAIAILIVVDLHEYIKARVSTSLGDPKPRMQGRLTLNPFKHFEPIGFIIMLAFNYGWGKPVETTATYYKDRKMGTIATYATPMVFCLAFGTLCAVLYRIITPAYYNFIFLNGAIEGINSEILLAPMLLLNYMAFYGLAFALFNLIPVYPLDGGKILSVFLNPNAVIKMNSIEKILLILLALLISARVIGAIFDPVVMLLLNAVGAVV